MATATTINKITITAPATGATLTIADGATLTASASATVSGTNTGDQTSIVGISGTKAQYNTSCSDGDFLFVGDVTAFSWGASINGATGTGVALAMDNSYAASGIGQSITIGNTQTQALTAQKIELGTSAQGHIGILINAANASTSARGISIDLSSTGTGSGIVISRSGTNVSSSAIRVLYNSATVVGTGVEGILFEGAITTPTTTSVYPFSTFKTSIASTSSIPATVQVQYQQNTANESSFPVESGSMLYAGIFVSGSGTQSVNTMAYGWRQTSALSKGIFGFNTTTEARTTDANRIYQRRTLSSAATQTDTFSVFNIRRESISNNASATLNAGGSVMKLENISTQTLGTLNDSVDVLQIVQDADSTGNPISITQNAVTSTNFRRLIKETATGITIWMGNGTTANGNLSGTAGDILINGGSNKPEYCTGTTNWTALV